MRPPAVRPVRRFLAQLVCVYALLILPWPGVRDGYATALRWGTTRLLGNAIPGAQIALRASAAMPGRSDTVIVVIDRTEPGILGRARLSSWTLGYLPSALVVSLAAATPLPWRRRLLTVLAGLVLAHAFIAVRVWLTALAAHGGLQRDPTWGPIIAATYRALVVAPLSDLGVPLFIWMAVALPQLDLRALVKRAAGRGA